MHLPHERRNRRESAVACANPMADDAAGARHAAGWLAGHFGMQPSLAFLETELADLEETR
jgi:hypothetical protein